MSFYSIDFPERVSFRLSDIVRKLIKARCNFDLIMQKEGISPMQLVVSCAYEIGDLLASAVAGEDLRCRISRMKVLRSDGYSLGLRLKHLGDATRLDIPHEIHGSMRSLLPEEKFRAVISVRRLLKIGRKSDTLDRAGLGLTILFAGSRPRLHSTFPPSRQRGLWKIGNAWKIHPRPEVSALKEVDNLLPSINETCRTRKSFPPAHGTLELDGIYARTASGAHRLLVDENFISENALVFGGTGTGKSSFLKFVARTLIMNGRAVCLIDPHGMLSTSLLGELEGREEAGRVVYVDPVKCPLGLNPFEVFRLEGKVEEVKTLMVESIGHTVRESFGQQYWGPRLEYLLGGMIKAVAPIRESNFVDVMELINNPFAGKELAGATADSNTKNFLLSVVPKAREDWWMSAMDKVGRIVGNEHSRTVLCRRKGNVDIARCIRDGRAIIANLDYNRMGGDISSLVGAMLISTFWIVASSQKTGATIIVDEAQFFPPSILESIAAQGRKFGVNIIFASQSPSKFGKKTLASLGSNFQNKVLLRLEELDAVLASEFIGDLLPEDIKSLEDLQAIIRSSGRTGDLSIEPPVTRDGAERIFIDAMKAAYTTEDDSSPSPLSSGEGQLFDVLQLVSMAERQGKQSISGIEETGALLLMGYGPSEMSVLVERARSMLLVQKAHLKLTQRGRDELLRLQGSILAGGEKHRSMILALKDIFDTVGFLTYIPMQRLGREQPDLILKTQGNIASTLFYMEIEVATKYQLEKRRKKVERAARNKAVPVFVFEEEGPAVSAVKGGEFSESLFLVLADSGLRACTGAEWIPLNGANDLIHCADLRRQKR